MAVGEIINMPKLITHKKPHPVSCCYCIHAAFGQYGTYCTMYHEAIWLEEAAAQDCADYEE